jgi:hypothetical protein
MEETMTRLATSAIVGLALALALPAAPAEAQLARTCVSAASGNDANDCNRLTPCRTFQVAHDKTLAAGEITVLDPGGYGAVTITKGISIINDGVGEAGVLVSGGLAGITINAGAEDAVSLRGLTVKGIGFGGGNGIVFNSGRSLTIENGAIRTLTGDFLRGIGIFFRPNAFSHLAVMNTIVADNSTTGVIIASGSIGGLSANLSRVQTINNRTHGLAVLGGNPGTAPVNVVVEDSIAARNDDVGFLVTSAGGPATLMLIRSVAMQCTYGARTEAANATLRISQSTLAGNAFGWSDSAGGVVQSYGDNNIDGNTSGGNQAPPLIPKK